MADRRPIDLGQIEDLPLMRDFDVPPKFKFDAIPKGFLSVGLPVDDERLLGWSPKVFEPGQNFAAIGMGR